jgi:hypothetical protein
MGSVARVAPDAGRSEIDHFLDARRNQHRNEHQ